MGVLLRPVTALDVDLAPTARDVILATLQAALDAVDPSEAVGRHVHMLRRRIQIGEASYNLKDYDRILVVGAGKASAAMASALENILGARISDGWINVKDGYTAPTRKVHLHEAGHPLPDERAVEGSRKIASLLATSSERDLVFCLISGGGSALMTLPAAGVSLPDLTSLTRLLLRCGATIVEINTLRKHVSRLKGGDLSRIACRAHVVSLIVSDVVGDPLDVIASGPTNPDPTTYQHAYAVLEKYGLTARVPVSIVRRLREGMQGRLPETPKPGDPLFERTQNLVVASNEHAARAALKRARAMNLHGMLLSTSVEGEAREVGKFFAAVAKEIDRSGQPLSRPACVVAGGETTVTLRGQGLGGRNQELALAAAMRIEGLQDVAVVALGTDGSDGPTDAAGAICTGRTTQRAAAKGLSPDGFLATNDAYRFFGALGDLIITGPTNTNVNDLTLVFAF
jgi:glycerate 2-kinase